jgi:hypothetical protein
MAQTLSPLASPVPKTDIFWAATTKTYSIKPLLVLVASPASTTIAAITTASSSLSHGALSSAAVAVTRVVAISNGAPTSTSSTSSDNHSSTIIGAAVGGSIGLFLFCLLFGILFCARRRRRKQKKILQNRELIRSSLSTALPQPQGADLEKGFEPRRVSSRPVSGRHAASTHCNTAQEIESAEKLSIRYKQPIEDVHPAFRSSHRDSLLHVAPSAISASTAYGSARRNADDNMPSASMPGQRYPPPQYPPPEVPSYPSRICSMINLPCKSSDAAWERKQSTRSTKSHNRPQSRSSSSASGPVVTFLPGAGRHSLSEGIIPMPAVNQTPQNSTSSSTFHNGKVLVQMPTNNSGHEAPSPFQDIEEEGPSASSRSSGIDDGQHDKTASAKENQRSCEASVAPRVASLTFGVALSSGHFSNATSSASRSTLGTAITSDAHSPPGRAQGSDTRRQGPNISEALQSPYSSRTPSPSAFVYDFPAAPQNVHNDSVERFPYDGALSLSVRSLHEGYDRNSPSVLSTRSRTPDRSRLSIKNVSSPMALSHKTSQSSQSVSSRAGSSAALIEDASKEDTGRDRMLNGGSPGSWWRA